MPLRPTIIRSVRRACAALASLSLAACGGDAADADSLAVTGDTVAAAAAAAPTAGADAPLAVADLEAYERALAAEIDVLRDAVAKRAAARTQADTVDALFAANELQTVPAAAERAGIEPARYRRLEQAFGAVLAARVQRPGMDALAKEMQQADTAYLAGLPPAQADSMRARLRASVADMQAATSDSALYEPVPTALRDEFRQRAAARLDSLWSERFALRARAAGLGG